METLIMQVPDGLNGRRRFLVDAGYGALAAVTSAFVPKDWAQAAGRRPNILYIMADDHAAHAISAYGSRVNRTPQIDRLAREGLRLDRCFAVNSICTPSRASILTGKYSHMNGVPVFNRFNGNQPTVAKHLQAAGYHTGMIGKWHLGSDPTGFDYWCILPGQGVYHNPTFLTPAGETAKNGYVTDIITDLSIDFLRSRPKDRPFFLMCHHKAPHRSWDPDEKHAKMYDDVSIPEAATLFGDYATRTDAAREATMTIANDLTNRDLKLPPPDSMKGPDRQDWFSKKPTEVTVDEGGEKQSFTGEALVRWKYQRYMKDYLRCIASIDDNVGRLLDFLDREGLRDNTLVIYTSDQGFFLGDHGWYDKRFMYEESIRMPFLVRWPGVTAPWTVQSAMALNIDFAPTFMEAAGLPVPADMQGRSLVPLLRGIRPDDWRRSMYYRYYHDPGDHNTRAHYGIRTETHKLICFWKKEQWECYDLVRDPLELSNVYSDPAYASVVGDLQQELFRLKKEVKDEDQFADSQPPNGVDPRPRRNPADGAGSPNPR
jgi:arylsulfatase A-like enzyme